MSVTPQGPGWWVASDGRWYPPELHPLGQGVPPPPLPDYQSPDEPDPEAASRRSDELPSFAEVVPAEIRTQGSPGDAGVREVKVSGGRTLEVLAGGPSWGTPLLFHHGTPFAAAPWPAATEAATRHGLRWVTWSRPGYGTSERLPQRTVADVAADAEAVLAALGHTSFFTLGWSTGGPYALACAAGLGDRCLAAATVGSPAPWSAEGIDWSDGSAPGLVEALGAASGGLPELRRIVEARSRLLHCGPGSHSGEEVAEPVAELASVFGTAPAAADVAAMVGGAARPLGNALCEGVVSGLDGWCDDLLALAGKWNFDLSAISVPTAVWHGVDDPWVPVAHGSWLTGRIPGSRWRQLAGEGHVSPVLRLLDAVLEDMADLSGSAAHGAA
ncbi:MAG: alpha/beta hydrolase [Acidimicrobiales bacterium]